MYSSKYRTVGMFLREAIRKDQIRALIGERLCRRKGCWRFTGRNRLRIARQEDWRSVLLERKCSEQSAEEKKKSSEGWIFVVSLPKDRSGI
jgi:hypothetical protein